MARLRVLPPVDTPADVAARERRLEDEAVLRERLRRVMGDAPRMDDLELEARRDEQRACDEAPTDA